MSNKIVPNIYRTVIDDVIANMKADFDENGVGEEVLAELQSKWERKVIASHVADFEPPRVAQPPMPPQIAQQAHPGYPARLHMMQHPYGPHIPYAPPPNGQHPIKAEPIDSRYILSAGYTLPALPGPHTSVLSFSASASTRPASNSNNGSIPQLDGPSEDSEDDSPSPPSFAPRSSHPSLPQPSHSQTASSTTAADEAINSELDDSDTDGDEEADENAVADSDIVFCTWDKVARVKNKWKCVLKDGMIHVNGKDYLFQKCSGEFEW